MEKDLSKKARRKRMRALGPRHFAPNMLEHHLNAYVALLLQLRKSAVDVASASRRGIGISDRKRGTMRNG